MGWGVGAKIDLFSGGGGGGGGRTSDLRVAYTPCAIHGQRDCLADLLNNLPLQKLRSVPRRARIQAVHTKTCTRVELLGPRGKKLERA